MHNVHGTLIRVITIFIIIKRNTIVKLMLTIIYTVADLEFGFDGEGRGKGISFIRKVFFFFLFCFLLICIQGGKSSGLVSYAFSR